MRHRIKPPDSNKIKGRIHGIDKWALAVLRRKLARLEQGEITVEGDPPLVLGRTDPAAPRRVLLRINDPRCFSHMLLSGTTGAAESYILGYWDTDDLVGLIEIMLVNSPAYEALDRGWAWWSERMSALWHALRKNSPVGSLRNIMAHYDLGNDFFATFLDETMAYSSGIFEKEDSTLHEASLAKFERICRKLRLSPSDTLLEIGTGWGGFAVYAAKHYGCRVTTTTISKEQYAKAWERVHAAGLDELVNVIDRDYRDLTGAYSKVVSIEMIEAVGHDYLETFLGACGRLLRDDGMLLIQGITVPDARYTKHRRQGSFINTYIFPGSHLVSVRSVCDGVAAATDMHLAGLEDITPHYARTLREWRKRFVANLDKVRELGMSETFIRMWIFYLVSCEAGFRQRWIGDVQWVFAKPRCRAELPALEIKS